MKRNFIENVTNKGVTESKIINSVETVELFTRDTVTRKFTSEGCYKTDRNINKRVTINDKAEHL